VEQFKQLIREAVEAGATDEAPKKKKAKKQA